MIFPALNPVYPLSLVYLKTDFEQNFYGSNQKEETMPRIPRNLIKDANRCYHVISRTTGQDYALGNLEKEYLMQIIKKLSSVYSAKVFTFCLLSNHFHLLIQMGNAEEFSDEEIERRFRIYYGKKRLFPKERIKHFRKKWSDLSEYVKEIKQGFSIWYNKMHDRKGYFWSERFKSVVVEDGAALRSCMAYIDLNAVRANLANRPEDYRFCGLGYHIQSGNKDKFLSIDFSVIHSGKVSSLDSYRKFVYEMGSLERSNGKHSIPKAVSDQEAKAGHRLSRTSLFRYRSRYFTESVVLGSKGFVKGIYGRIQPYLRTREDRDPIRIHGVKGLYSLRRFRPLSPS
jgi:putative transposase